MKYRTINWDRQKLYDEVWEKPTVQLAKQYGISDVALSKICKKLKIPKPGPGYWRRKELGFKVTRTPLPATKESLVAVSHIPLSQPAKRDQIPQELRSELNPPASSSRKHQLVRQTEQVLEKGHSDTYGRLDPTEHRTPQFRLRVTQSGLPRAIVLMDQLVKLLEANGIEPKAGSKENASLLHFSVDGEQIRVVLQEVVRGRKRDLTPQERKDRQMFPTLYRQDFKWIYDPAGKFTFEIENYSDAQRKWTETSKRKLEEYFHDIVFAMRAAAAHEKRWRAEREAARKREEEEQRRRWKFQERVERLKRNVSSWEEAERIRAYLAAVRKKTEAQEGGIREGSPIAHFLAWAERYAESLDPSGGGARDDWAEDI